MILNHYFKYFLLIFISLFLFYFEALANDNLDNKVKSLTLELRCMTCQNQSIYDSDAEFSNDIKKIVKMKFEEGKSEYEIKQLLVEIYGEYILFKPLFNFKNLFLWAFPFILLAIGLFFLIFLNRKNKVS